MLITLSFFGTIWNIIIFLIVLGVVICLHELGHFFFAKRAGILCHEFSFGMGPRIWGKKFGETVFSIRAIPFGGYVSMAGEEVEEKLVKIGQKIRLGFDNNNEVNRIVLNTSNKNYQDYLLVTVENLDISSPKGTRLYINEYTVKRNAMYVMDKQTLQIAPNDRSFSYKTKWQRFLTAFGGPLMNFILAFVVYLLIAFVAGVPNLNSTTISAVEENTPAYGILEPGDTILSINNVEVDSWANGNASIANELAKTYTGYDIIVKRNGIEKQLETIKPQLIFYGLGFTSAINTDDLIIGSPLYVDSELQAEDKIISIDGVTMSSWDDVISFAKGYTEGSTKENPTEIVVMRNGELLTFDYVVYAPDVLQALGYQSFTSRIGVAGSNKFSFFGSFSGAWDSFVAASLIILRTIKLLFSSNQVGISDLSGFVGIYSMTSQAAKEGIISLLSWVGLLSVNLGIVNLLPIPALDGGRLVFIGFEAITKRKPNQKFENWLNTIMFILLMGLLIYITYHDIVRMIANK